MEVAWGSTEVERCVFIVVLVFLNMTAADCTRHAEGIRKRCVCRTPRGISLRRTGGATLDETRVRTLNSRFNAIITRRGTALVGGAGNSARASFASLDDDSIGNR